MVYRATFLALTPAHIMTSLAGIVKMPSVLVAAKRRNVVASSASACTAASRDICGPIAPTCPSKPSKSSSAPTPPPLLPPREKRNRRFQGPRTFGAQRQAGARFAGHARPS